MSLPTGHRLIQARFLRALKQGRLPHAWLFYGPKGIGKSMLAETLAAAYLCERNRSPGRGEACCGNCHSCKMLKAGSHPDFCHVGLIEKKRDVSVEQIRQLLSFLQLSGMESGRRVAVLNDAEFLNIQASNALLKGLEEPASGNLILLLSSDHMRLLPTIRSRCILHHVAPLSDHDCRKALHEMGVEGSVLDLAIGLACGRPGRVHAMQDTDICKALATWCTLTTNPAEMDVGAVEAWIGRNINRVPHDLISETVLQHLDPDIVQCGSFTDQLAVLKVAEEIAKWPELVRRHSLRPAQSLLAQLLCLRLSLRSLQQTA